MDQSCINRQPFESAISAEEFLGQGSLAGSGQHAQSSCCNDWSQSSTCGGWTSNPCNDWTDCNHSDCGCDWQRPQMVCCCRPIPAPPPEPVAPQEGCCCKQSFRAALRLLCNEELSTLLDFDLAAFITDNYIAGGTLSTTVATTGPADNLTSISGSFRRFAPCSCDLLDISADLVTVPDTSTSLTVNQVNVCELGSVIFQLAETAAEGDLSAEEVAARNFRRVKCLLSQRLNPCSVCGDDHSCCPSDCQDCCCAAGLLSALAESNLSRRVSLAAGPLLLHNVNLLGTAGNVLVLANDTERRIYFVCVNHIQFLA